MTKASHLSSTISMLVTEGTQMETIRGKINMKNRRRATVKSTGQINTRRTPTTTATPILASNTSTMAR